jgi:L-arabinose isomerase
VLQRPYRFWFVTGSQHLYGPDTLGQVAAQARQMLGELANSADIGFDVIDKGVLTNADAIRRIFLEANADDTCAGVIAWMHTFSPAKTWISGLSSNQKPLLHLHTQFHRDIPWDSIDMDFMNLNQSAHGDREFGFMTTRLKMPRKVIMGHWSDRTVQHRIGAWMKVAVGWAESQHLKMARFGDNMRDVAVTEGDKVEAAIRLGWSVQGYGVGDLAEAVEAVSGEQIDEQLDIYRTRYTISRELETDPFQWNQVRGQAKIERGIRTLLEQGGFTAFTTTFEDLHGLDQLPGLAVQNLMHDGYGFGAEGDWKTAALLRVVKVMAGLAETSFMEDYTYHLEPGKEAILGAHMLEVCPTIAEGKPRIEVHPLSIGGRSDPARLVFDGRPGPAICASLVDLGRRFRLIVNQVEAMSPEHGMPRLPVGRVLWKPLPALQSAAEAWIYAGGAHHTVFSYPVSAEQMEDWAALAGVECITIDRNTEVRELVKELRFGERAWES